MAATFVNPTFGFKGYAAARPSYSALLYQYIFGFHRGSIQRCVDLGTGHGTVARSIAGHFGQVIAFDPSEGMLKVACENTPQERYPNVSYHQGSAETLSSSLDSIPSSQRESCVDIAVSGQAAHWFDYSRAWPELAKVIRKGGSIAFWTYSLPIFPGHFLASQCLAKYALGEEFLGPYWSQPGSSICANLLRDVHPPEEDWEDVTRVEYVPSANPSVESVGPVLMEHSWRIGELQAFTRTWSAVHKWGETHPERKERDIIDEMFGEMSRMDAFFHDPDAELTVQWGVGLLMARRK